MSDPNLAFVKRFGFESVEAYQAWHNLKPDGYVGPIARELMSQPRCGVPDVFPEGALKAGGINDVWPVGCRTIPTSYSMSLNLSSSEIAEAWDAALALWNQSCGLTLTRIGTQQGAKIYATSGPLGGSTLAWSYLPEGRCNDVMRQQYDTRNWSVEYLAKVILHEIGHAIGLTHSQDITDVMYPSIQNRPLSDYPSTGDVARVVRFYGPAEDDPPPPPPPPGPSQAILTVSGTLEPGEYRVVRKLL